ncbi:CCR4-NOT transcription complex subunit 9-like [Triticum dicoccoides]|uniref:CCR4-NOT transcription complex subunit 9-like n=1 Tax=Triticum dicoccoides TaxID=85692 RepID=UPI001891E6ED|nr:CCR4-NOT transcription complex subunit 9-like [Triticum dicoccoides]
MANLPPALAAGPSFGAPSPPPLPPPSGSSAAAPPAGGRDRKMVSAEQLVLDLCDPELRENALLELSKKREIFQDLAPLLWHSFGTVAALLQEIVSIYPSLSPPTLSPVASNRVCNALALLQCVASHPETRIPFLNAHIPLYLYPFLNTTSKTRPFEYLRLTSLGVIGALVKVDDSEVIGFLLQTEIIPLCLHTMEMGSELSKTVATFIVQKILLDDIGLRYICATAERFFAVATVLAQMVQALAEQPSARLLKHIIRCYLRLTENQRACAALNSCLPTVLKDGTFNNFLLDDNVTRRWLQQLLSNMSIAGMGGGSSHTGMGGGGSLGGMGGGGSLGGMGMGGGGSLGGMGGGGSLGGGMGGGGSLGGVGGGGPHGGLDHLMGL